MFYRQCPFCHQEISYKLEVTRNRALEKKSICRSCAGAIISNRPDIKEKSSIRMKEFMSDKLNRDNVSVNMKKFYSNQENRNKISERQSKRIGELNGFFGKTHSDETKKRMVENKNYDYAKTDEFKEKSKRVGEDNGMYGKCFYDIWVQKFGIEKADEIMKEFKVKKSEATAGEKNPMYCKPAPIGSGGGWSGWYGEWFFRSLRELTYVIQVIEKNGWKWRTAETADMSIDYVGIDGNKRTYRADFIINENTLVEIKPKQLMNTKENEIKKKAAEEFCHKRGLNYEMVDQIVLTFEEVTQLLNEGKIILTKKWETRLIEYNNKKRGKL